MMKSLISLLLLVILGCVAPVGGMAQDYGGVGAQVVPTVDGLLVVLRVVEDSPAQKAGLLPGDLIDAIDGMSLLGQPFEDVVLEKLAGPIGSAIELRFQRPGVVGHHVLVVNRERVNRPQTEIPGVRTVMPPGGDRNE